ncbi:MAG: hypothetical protein PHF56_13105 [Desulfuromonadaceae bacterium]|nr:hypothetical protein [Desulfuromonadaceae bacterium]
MLNKIKIAVTELEIFKANQGNEHVINAVESLEEVNLLSIKQNSERLIARHELLLAWCRVLSVIEELKDPDFDPDDAPSLNITPPLDSSNEIPPKSMSPEAQKQFEKAVTSNEEKKTLRRTQLLVRELEARAVESAHRITVRWYTKSAADQKEVESVFQDAGISDAKKVQILSPPTLPTPDHSVE